MDWLHQLFDTSSFPARWHCGSWSSLHGWIHIVSDMAIFLSYLTIPVLIGSFMVRKKEIPFPRIFLLFACFIFACGTVHLIEVFIFWHPVYRFSALIKIITAVVSVVTVIVIIPNFPFLMAMKSAREFESELAQRQKAEQELRHAYQHLELLVSERTQELQRSNRDLEQFAHAVSHDLRAPLRAIINLSTWIEEELGDTSSELVRQYMTLLQDRTLRMRSMLQGLLEYARVGKQEEKIEQVDVKTLCQNVIDLLAPPPHIQIHYLEPLPVFETWQAPLQQVFLNLISNAIKHGGTGGHIRIGCTHTDTMYHFFVSDDGPGIDPAYHDQIFELYKTLETRDSGESTGMGLALFKRVVEEVGGAVSLESAPGQGATFGFTWPRRTSS